jgi:tetratricopeptide (TPR) repeat protein
VEPADGGPSPRRTEMLLSLLLVLLPPSGQEPLAHLLTRARQHLEASDSAAARKELVRALELYPGSPTVYNFLGVLEAADGNAAMAERRFREAVARDPRYTDAYLNLGRLYRESAGRDRAAARRALATYQAILGYAPDHAEARFQSASLLEVLGEYGRSLDELKRLARADQDRPGALGIRLADDVGRGEREEAAATMDRLLARPDLTEADLRPLLSVLSTHGRDDLALRLLETLRARGWASADDLRSAGLIQEKEGRLAFAREALEQAALARPEDVTLLLDLARVSHEERDYKGALGYLAHARALAPDNARVHFFFGIVCVDMDLGAEAYKSLKEAVRLDPDNPAINYAMGAVALQRKDPGEALPYFRKYAELKPDDPRGPYAIGIAAFRAKDYATARAQLLPAAERRETAAVANYLLARMARVENDFEKALAFARRAVDAKPDYADSYSELGLVYMHLGRLHEAEKALDRCLELEPDHYLGNMQLALLYAREKDPRAAAQRQRFEEVKKRAVQKGIDFLRPIEVRPY